MKKSKMHEMEPAGVMDTASEEAKEPMSEHELEMHHDTLMKAEHIKSQPHVMKQLKPIMEKKMGHMKSLMSEGYGGEKIDSIEKLKHAAKKKIKMNESSGSY